MQRSTHVGNEKRALAVLAIGGVLTIVAAGATGCGRSAQTSLSSADSKTAQQVVCPDVRSRMPQAPATQQAELARNLDLLDQQVAEANRRLKTLAGQGGPRLAQNAVLGPLQDKRAATLDRINISFRRAGQQPPGLDALQRCRLTGAGGDGEGDGGQNGGGQGGQNGAGVVGPSAGDFVDIRTVRPNRRAGQQGGQASGGSFTSACGTDQEKHQNTDNIIVAPGKPNGAEHLHDYVGNLSTDFSSTDESLAAADTSCAVKADKSTYFWPVLRVRAQGDAGQGAAEKDKNNVGTAVLPSKVILRYTGNARGKVTAMPQFLRLFSGDDVPFAVDGFATEQHKPNTDHGGYINVMSGRLNAGVAKCINENRKC